MKTTSKISALLGATLLVTAFAPMSRADEWDKKTFVTFSQPVEVPGVVLPAGKYVFRLVDSPADRHIVRIMNARENHVFATILAVPDYRLETPSKSIFAFYEMPVGQPEALKEWFYPGDNYGQEFVYGKKRMAEIALAVKQRNSGETVAVLTPAATPVEEQKTTIAEDSQVKSETTTATETPAAEPAAEPPAPTDVTPEEQTPAPAPEPQQPTTAPSTPSDTPNPDMPKTASQFVLTGLLGLLGAAGAISARRFRK
jgi:hypothetical protein